MTIQCWSTDVLDEFNIEISVRFLEGIIMSGNEQNQDWTCVTCTFINSDNTQYCQACYQRNLGYPEGHHQNSADEDILVWSCDECQHTNYVDIKYCDECCEFRDDDVPITTLSRVLSKERIQIPSNISDIEGLGNKSPVANMAENAERRILLIGRTGAGKSATANSLLNAKHFHSAVSGMSITTKCEVFQAQRFGRMLTVVDTPGIFDTRFSNETISEEMIKCTEMILPGPHAIILVIKIGRFTKEVQDTVKHFVDHFGEDIFKFMVIIFTGRDDLEDENISLDQFIKNSTSDLKQLVKKCNSRCISFNNRASTKANDQQCMDLLEIVNKMLFDNDGNYFTNEMLKEAELNFCVRLMRIKEDEDRERQEKIHKFKRLERKRRKQELEKVNIETDRLFSLQLTKQWENEEKQRKLEKLIKEKTFLEQKVRKTKR